MHSRTLVKGTLAAACLIMATGLYAGAMPSYRLDLDVNYAEGSFRGAVHVTYTNETADPQSEVFFRLYANADVVYGSASLSLLSSAVNGMDVSAELFAGDTVLMLPLPEPLPPAGSVEVALDFEGRAARTTADRFASPGEYGLLTKSDGVLTLTGFYPILAPSTEEGWVLDPVEALGDALFADAARYEVSVVVEPTAVLIPTPDLSSVQSDGRIRWTFARDGLRDFPLVLVEGDRAAQEAEASGVRVRAWFSPQHSEAAAVALARGTESVDLYSSLFGPLPYSSVDIVEAPLQQVAGVELSGLFLVSEGYSSDPHSNFFTTIVSHETAHQWFYAAVGNDPVEAPWLDEALATYASTLLYASAFSDSAVQAQDDSWSLLYDRARSAYPGLTVKSPLYDFPDSGTYSAIVYLGGALELDLLRRQLGDDAFFSALAEYYASQRFAVAEGADLLASFRRACDCWPGGALFNGGAAPAP